MMKKTAPERRGKPTSATARAYDVVKTAILRGDYAGGEFLEEETVCRAAGVSRTPVREAFHRLASERFLDLLPRRGARVRPVTSRDMLDLYETRRLIESFAIERVCNQGGDDLDLMAGIASEMRVLGAADIQTHVELDRLFHRTLVASARNAILVEAYDGLQARQQRVALAALTSDPSRLDVILDEHDRLLAALSAQDVRTARRVLRAHLRPIPSVIERLP